MPTRIINVRSSTDEGAPFLEISNSIPSPARYVALSYVWGPNGHEVLLTHDTIEHLRTGIDTAKLSKTFVDAIQITRELGFQYLWTDALCIMQGDPEDWSNESKKMADVFGNAYLTIVAGSAAKAHDGFLQTPLRRSISPCQLRYQKWQESEADLDMGDCYVHLPRSKRIGPLEKRAWCYQEQILSPRRIIYGSDQIFFVCQRNIFCEDGNSKANKAMTGSFNMPNAQSIIDSPKSLPPKAVLLRYWYGMLREYTARNMTNPHDKLPAISGIASLVQKIVGCRYLAGIWEEDLIRGLSWTAAWFYSSEMGQPLTRPLETSKIEQKLLTERVTRAPSWSWASVEGTVRVDASDFGERVWCNPVHRRLWPQRQQSTEHHDSVWWCGPDEAYSSTSSPSMMAACELHVRGSLQRVRVLNAPMDAQREKFYDDCAKSANFFTYAWAIKKPHSIPLTAIETYEWGDQRRSGKFSVFGFGWFDVAEETRDFVFCTRLVSRQGLMLKEVTAGKFQRLGCFVVRDDCESWFDQLQLEDFVLV